MIPAYWIEGLDLLGGRSRRMRVVVAVRRRMALTTGSGQKRQQQDEVKDALEMVTLKQ